MNHPCDGQTDGIAIANARLAYMLSHAKSILEVPVDDYIYYGLRMCVVAIIRISYTLFMNFVRYCCLASSWALALRLRLVLASKISQLPRPRLELSASCLASSSKKLPRVHHCIAATM